MRMYFTGLILLFVAAVAASALNLVSISQTTLSNHTASHDADTAR